MTMSEYVELGEIISVLKQRYDRLSGLRPDFYAGYMAAVGIIKQETRNADVAPVVHAKWDVNGHCTNCGGHAPFYCMTSTYYKSPYCFECGAKMRCDNEQE